MIKCSFTVDSIFMQMPVTVHVALPYPNFRNKKITNLWALHCAKKNGEYFFNELGLLNIVDSLSYAVIAPDLGNTFFSDTEYAKAGSFLRRELFEIMAEKFGLSMQREQNSLLGISMGAYGALAWLLNEPNLFNKAYLLSGVYDFAFSKEFISKIPREQHSLFRAVMTMNKLIYNDGQYVPGCDLTELLANCTDNSAVIRMFCGQQDGLSLEPSENMLKKLQAKGFDASLSVSSGGHEGNYWRRCLDSIFAKESLL